MTARRKRPESGQIDWTQQIKRAEAASKKNTAKIEAGVTYPAHKPNTLHRKVKRD